MPNYCEVEIDLQFADPAEAKRFYEIAGVTPDNTDNYLGIRTEEKGYALFDRFLPTPAKELEDGGDWYSWRLDNWGCKWNPEINLFDTYNDGLSIRLGMLTPWSPPREFFIGLTEMFPSANVLMTYLEEGMGFCGKAYIEGGAISDKYINDIPNEMYLAIGYQLTEEGEIDWDIDPSGSLWDIIENDDEFEKYYAKEQMTNA